LPRRRSASRRARPRSSRRSALAAAIDYVDAIGLEAIHAHEAALVRQRARAAAGSTRVRLFGPEDSAGIVSFALDGVHPHDLGTILDEENVAIRAGHHCAQPLMDHLGVAATARASFGIYSDESDIAALLRGIERTQEDFRLMNDERAASSAVERSAAARESCAAAPRRWMRKRQRKAGAQARLPRRLPCRKTAAGIPANRAAHL
jgi:hypothetical protein